MLFLRTNKGSGRIREFSQAGACLLLGGSLVLVKGLSVHAGARSGLLFSRSVGRLLHMDVLMPRAHGCAGAALARRNEKAIPRPPGFIPLSDKRVFKRI